MKIYFAGAIRGGRDDALVYKQIIEFLQNIGQVLTEHIGDQNLNQQGEIGNRDEFIYTRDMKWINSADVIIAEVTKPSLGVGYELAIAEKLNIPVLCLYRYSKDSKISAMIMGNNKLECLQYDNILEAQYILEKFFKKLKGK